MILQKISLPEKFAFDIEKAVEILKNEGCVEIFIFGSLVNKQFNENSDIDIAVRGLPSKSYFKVIGKLLIEIDTPVDLVDLDDKENSFVKILEEKGELIRVA